MKRKAAQLTLADAMQLIPVERSIPWQLEAPSRPPSDVLLAMLERGKAFGITDFGAGKLLSIPLLLAEIVPHYPRLKGWFQAPLESDLLTGFADYLIAPKLAYITTPLLCGVDAPRDDHYDRTPRCLALMTACRWINQQRGHTSDLYGFISNGHWWDFYRLTPTNQLFALDNQPLSSLPELLGVLDSLIAACAANVPPSVGGP